jgi:hypothetical protein
MNWKRTSSIKAYPTDLEGAALKVNRAETLAHELTESLNAWRALPCYQLLLGPNSADPNRVVATVTSIQSLPKEIPIILGEVMYLLGSALDHLICALARRQGHAGRGYYFPIRDSQEEFEKALSKLKGLTPSDKEVIRSFRPFKTSDPILWSIRKLTNRDKHEMLVLVAAVQQVRFGGQALDDRGEAIPGMKIEAWSPNEDLVRLELGNVFDLPRPRPELQGRLTVFAAFDEPEIFGGRLPILGSFNLRAINRVREVLGRFP